MQTKQNAVTASGTAPRTKYVTEGALRWARARGLSEETQHLFVDFAMEHCPEVQGFNNLLDYFLQQ